MVVRWWFGQVSLLAGACYRGRKTKRRKGISLDKWRKMRIQNVAIGREILTFCSLASDTLLVRGLEKILKLEDTKYTSLGLGNIWRFPYLCFKHGGGAFLLLHTVMLFLVGIPCFFLEISIGQYSGLGPVTLFSNMVPLFKGKLANPSSENRLKAQKLVVAGLGFTTFVASAIVSVYYNVLMAWIIYYIFASLNSELPWNTCDHDYNTDCEHSSHVLYSTYLMSPFSSLLQCQWLP